MDKGKMKDARKKSGDGGTSEAEPVTCGASQRVNFWGTIVAKNREHINRHWSDSYCLKDKKAAVYLSHLFHIANIIYLNQNDSKPLCRWWDFWLFVLYFHLGSCIPTIPSLTPGVWGIVSQGGNDIMLTGQVEIAFWFWLLTFPLPG